MTNTYHSDEYAQVYARSLTEPESFWSEQASHIPWKNAPETILDLD